MSENETSLPTQIYNLKEYLRIAEKLANDKGVYDPAAVFKKMTEEEKNWVKPALTNTHSESFNLEYDRHIHKGIAYDKKNDKVIIDFGKIADSLNDVMRDEFWQGLKSEVADTILYLLDIRDEKEKSTSFELLTPPNENYRGADVKPTYLLSDMLDVFRFNYEIDVDSLENFKTYMATDEKDRERAKPVNYAVYKARGDKLQPTLTPIHNIQLTSPDESDDRHQKQLFEEATAFFGKKNNISIVDMEHRIEIRCGRQKQWLVLLKLLEESLQSVREEAA